MLGIMQFWTIYLYTGVPPYLPVHVARMGEERGVHRVLVGKPEGKRPLGRPRRRWEDNIKMDLQEFGCRGVWTELIWFRIGTGRGNL
jgi:hypothetical protein